MPREIPGQLTFDLGETTAAPKQEIAIVLRGEALPPQPRVLEIVPAEPVTAESYAPSEGQLEHAYLLHRIGKFEDRANAALNTALGVSVLAVLAKGGIPLSSALLEKLTLPGIGDGRLLTGLLAVVMLILAGTAAYYVLQVRHHASQMQIPRMRRTLAGDIAQAMVTVGTIASVVVVVGVACLCLGDMLYAFSTLLDHLQYTMTGWDARVGPP